RHRVGAQAGGGRGEERRGAEAPVGEHAPEAEEDGEPEERERALPLPGESFADLHSAHRGITSKSVRRFFARPSSVLLLATGLSGPLATTPDLPRSRPSVSRHTL